MADHAEYLRTKFTVAVHLDEEQKRQIEIRRLRDDAQLREQQPSRQQDFEENRRDITSAASPGTDADRTDEDRNPHETTLERIRRERIEAWERERQSDRDFDREL